MLTTLRIKNLALVEDLTLELKPGYNVITGETGAGKSILIGALNLAMGERADRSLIRSGAETCSVEAAFDVQALNARLGEFFTENGLEGCEDSQLVIKRTFTNTGMNRQFVNGSPTTLSILAQLGELLVDIHGPHEHQSLLSPAQQLEILDAFGGLEKEREGLGQLLRDRDRLNKQKAALVVDERTYVQQLDLLRFQVNEISAARLRPEEDVEVEADFTRASNAARLLQLGQAALDLVSENESSLLTQSGIVGRTLQELQRIDASAAPLQGLHEQTVACLRDLQGELSRYLDRIEVDPRRLQELEERLNLLHSLRRKYGATVAEVIRFGEEADRKLKQLEGRDAELARINSDLMLLDRSIWRAGRELSNKRRKLVPQISRAVSRELAELGFRQSRFDILISSEEEPSEVESGSQISSVNRAGNSPAWHQSGLDTVEFQFAPNPGEPPRALRAIASSGELARVMLALKTVLASVDRIPVLVFDEVDANVGGETGHAVGQKMRRIAEKRQVLCITHLAQVAAPATSHFVATKQVKSGRTTSELKCLAREERVTELARMLGGQSEAARKHAEELLKR